MLATIFENVKNDRQFSASTGLHKVEFYELLYVYEEVEAQERDWQKKTPKEQICPYPQAN